VSYGPQNHEPFWPRKEEPKRIFTVGDTDLDMDGDPYTTIVNLEHALDLAEKLIVELEKALGELKCKLK
jgi:hypothetical protein